MKVPDISEEERVEIYTALQERKEALEKLSKETDKKHVPTDRIDERLAIYRDGDQIVNNEKCVRPGLISLFAPEPQLSTEARAAKDGGKRDPNGGADLFGGGTETGGGHPPGEKGVWKGKPRGDAGDEFVEEADATVVGTIPGSPKMIGSGKQAPDPRTEPGGPMPSGDGDEPPL
jgi:hypothetical protein